MNTFSSNFYVLTSLIIETPKFCIFRGLLSFGAMKKIMGSCENALICLQIINVTSRDSCFTKNRSIMMHERPQSPGTADGDDEEMQPLLCHFIKNIFTLNHTNWKHSGCLNRGVKLKNFLQAQWNVFSCPNRERQRCLSNSFYEVFRLLEDRL